MNKYSINVIRQRLENDLKLWRHRQKHVFGIGGGRVLALARAQSNMMMQMSDDQVNNIVSDLERQLLQVNLLIE
jgi:hypothetical protein